MTLSAYIKPGDPMWSPGYTSSVTYDDSFSLRIVKR